VTTLAITINGHALGPTDVRDDLTMNDFLREHLGMTGTKFGCGAGQCLSCAWWVGHGNLASVAPLRPARRRKPAHLSMPG
jgi:aerobic-type carbon monoxide dehydrogenase small subunit (CoxS/CutS family)